MFAYVTYDGAATTILYFILSPDFYNMLVLMPYVVSHFPFLDYTSLLIFHFSFQCVVLYVVVMTKRRII